MKIWRILAFVGLLIPSAWLAWEYRDMPQLGWSHDDGIYFAGAKSIAAGEGHKIPFLPGSPAQTKYPPLFPMLLAPIWWLEPAFPANLELATLFSWLMLPPLLYLCLKLYRSYGIPDWAAWLLVGLFAVHPFVTLFSRTLRSEMPFTLLLLGVMLAAPRSAILAGTLAGLAYLARTAGLPLLVALPALYAWKREWRKASLFAASMLPFVFGWALWQRANKPGGSDPYILYYLDYVWYEFYNVSLSNLPTVIYKNLDGIFSGIAAPVLPFIGNELEMILGRVIAIGIAIGVYKLAVECEAARPYALFALLSTIMLVVWHVTPNGRFLFPVFPLLFAGFFVMAQRTVLLVQSTYRDPKQRRAATVIGGLLVCLAAFMIWNHLTLTFDIAPANTTIEASMSHDMMACGMRLKDELPPNAAILSDNDPLLYLQTGRTSMRLVVPSKHWYKDGSDGMLRESLRIREVAKSHDLRYFLTHGMYDRDSGGQAAKFNAAIDRDPNLHLMFRCGNAAVYEIN